MQWPSSTARRERENRKKMATGLHVTSGWHSQDSPGRTLRSVIAPSSALAGKSDPATSTLGSEVVSGVPGGKAQPAVYVWTGGCTGELETQVAEPCDGPRQRRVACGQ